MNEEENCRLRDGLYVGISARSDIVSLYSARHGEKKVPLQPSGSFDGCWLSQSSNHVGWLSCLNYTPGTEQFSFLIGPFTMHESNLTSTTLPPALYLPTSTEPRLTLPIAGRQ